MICCIVYIQTMKTEHQNILHAFPHFLVPLHEERRGAPP